MRIFHDISTLTPWLLLHVSHLKLALYGVVHVRTLNNIVLAIVYIFIRPFQDIKEVTERESEREGARELKGYREITEKEKKNEKG